MDQSCLQVWGILTEQIWTEAKALRGTQLLVLLFAGAPSPHKLSVEF